MKNIQKTLQILLIVAVAFSFVTNFVVAQEGPGASTSEESDQTGSNSETPAESGPGASNSTEEDQTSGNDEGPGASNSEESDQTGSSNIETPDSSSSEPSDQDSNTSYDSLSGSCSADSSSITVGQSVNWTAEVEGGNGIYSYNWSGDDSLSGTSKTISHTYNLAGTFAASVEVSSPALEESENLTLNCGSVEVTEEEEEETTSASGRRGGGGGSNSNNNDEEGNNEQAESSEETETNSEEDLTTEEIVAFLDTLTPQTDTESDVPVLAAQITGTNEETESNNETEDENIDSENTDILNAGDNQLAAIGGINLDWLTGLFDNPWSLAWIFAVLATLGILYFILKKRKSNK